MGNGPFINPVTRDAAFFDLVLPPPPPSSRSLFLEIRRVTLFFTVVRLLSVYFGLASRAIFAVRDCVTFEVFLRFPPSPLVTRDAIYGRPLICDNVRENEISKSSICDNDVFGGIREISALEFDFCFEQCVFVLQSMCKATLINSVTLLRDGISLGIVWTLRQRDGVFPRPKNTLEIDVRVGSDYDTRHAKASETSVPTAIVGPTSLH